MKITNGLEDEEVLYTIEAAGDSVVLIKDDMFIVKYRPGTQYINYKVGEVVCNYDPSRFTEVLEKGSFAFKPLMGSFMFIMSGEEAFALVLDMIPKHVEE